MIKKLGLFKANIKITQPTCPWWFLFTFDNPFRRLYQNPSKILAPHISPGDKVADIGCGMGYFSIPLAQLVGVNGKVIAVDLQAQMLEGLRRRADKQGICDRILLHQCSQDKLGIKGQIDFALAFWMVHEVHDQKSFLDQIFERLNPGGKLLIAEPYLHVSKARFREIESDLASSGLKILTSPAVGFSRTLLAVKEN